MKKRNVVRSSFKPIDSQTFVAVSMAVSLVVFFAFVSNFLPLPSGRLAGDYEYFLPLLLAGKYWVAENGPLAPPVFTPAFCGGVPLLANPQSIFYSLPQLLSFVVDPVRAFLLTTIIFASIGAGSTYFLLRRSFQSSIAASLLGSVLFLFNGFLLHRMISGQVTYHATALVPVAAYTLLGDPSRASRTSIESISLIAAIGAIVGYVIYAGALNMIVPFGIAVVLIWYLHAIIVAPVKLFWLRGLLGGLLGIALGAMKLAPSIAFVWMFPRPDHLVLLGFIPLVAGLFYGFVLPFAVLPTLRPEFDFGIGPVPLFMFLMPLFFRAHWKLVARRIGPLWPRQIIPLCVLLLIPIIINYDGPGFQPFLQKLPYIGNNVILTRWWFIYITFLIPVCAVLFDAMIPSQRERNLVASCGMLVTALYAIGVDHSYYLQQDYDPAEITQANDRLIQGESAPPILAIADDTNGLASGNSRFPCYEPMFGYHLQTFPGTLERKSLDGGGRLVNPSCYIYGNVNGCSPGDKFSVGSDAQAEFAAYRPFPYVVPIWQRCADIVTLIAIGLCGAFLMSGVIAAARRWWLRYWSLP